MIGNRVRALLLAAAGLTACGSTAAAPGGGTARTNTAPGTQPAATGGSTGSAPTSAPIRFDIRVLAEHPHDSGAWTEGLEVYGHQLLESTGRNRESTLRLVDPTTGTVVRQIEVADDLYAEGVTVVDGQAVQLTWKDQTLLTTPLPDLDPAAVVRRARAYQGEGWGLCYDGTRLVMSDGSDQLQFRDPATFAVQQTVEVTRDGKPLDQLNELECVGGQVWANVWLTTEIVLIDPTSGVVVGWADLDDLVPPDSRRSDGAVPNGIAFDPGTGHFWLTGKLWSVIYEVILVPASP